MNFKLKSPCKDCPFRTDVDLFMTLGIDRITEIANAVAKDNKTFACHKTTNHDDESGEAVQSENDTCCAGALVMVAKQKAPNQMMQIAERFGLYDPTKINMDAPVYDSADHMIETYKERGLS